MIINDLQIKALGIREKYKQLEIKKWGKEWNNTQLAQGFVKDTNDLLKLIKNNENTDKLKHELVDCLWSILVLADKLNINLEESFFTEMDKIEKKLNSQLYQSKKTPGVL